MKIVIGITLVFGMIAMFIWNSVPRLASDLWHGREFTPSRNFTITKYECTNWNVFMWNECTTTFMSHQTGVSQQITDWRYGWAPSDPVQLMQWRDEPASVTTDVSLRTLWNRLLVALTLVLLGLLTTIGLLATAFGRADGAPADASGAEPAPQRTGGTFGKRRA